MARFNAAVMSGAQDDKFQNRYNYLLDLLDMGYIVEKMIGGSMSRIEISPSVGIKVSYGTTDLLSIDPTTGDLRVSGVAFNVGAIDVGGFNQYGLGVFASADETLTGFKSFNLGYSGLGMIASDNDASNLTLKQNAVYKNSYWYYADTNYASILQLINGELKFYQWGSGTGGDVATGITNPFTILKDTGDVLLGNGNNLILQAGSVGSVDTGDIVFKYSGGELCRVFPLTDTHLYRRYGGVNNKIWDSGNDGSGSGLDADLLDGQHGSYYFSSAYLSGRSLTDANNADVEGFMAHQLLSTASNKPTGTDHSLLTLSFNSAWSTQMAGDWRTNQWYVRTQNNGTWTSWKEVWNSGSLPIDEGSWSPSVINSLNLTSIVITSARYYRIGKLVQCWVAGSCSITATNTRTYFSISNPFNQINMGYPQGGGGGFQQSVSPFANVAARIADDSASTSNTAILAQSAWTGSSTFSMCYSYHCA